MNLIEALGTTIELIQFLENINKKGDNKIKNKIKIINKEISNLIKENKEPDDSQIKHIIKNIEYLENIIKNA